MELRVATWNLYLGADLSLLFGVRDSDADAVVVTLLRQLSTTDFRARADAIAGIVVEQELDVLGLQEVTTWSRDGSVVVDFLSELERALAARGAAYGVHAVSATFGGAAYGLGIRGSNVTLVRADLRVEDVRTGTFGAGLTVPLPTGDLRIDRSWGSVQVAGLTCVTTHTEAYDAVVRDAQRDELLATVPETGPVVLLGDLNATPDVVGLPAPWRDAWQLRGQGDGFTCGQAPDLSNPVSGLRERIDYVWVREAEVEECRLIGHRPEDRTPSGLWPSDHAGVLARVRFAGVGAPDRERLTARGRS